MSVSLSLLLILSICSTVAAGGGGGGGGQSAAIGINYGQVANNLLPPPSVIPLLRSLNINRVKLYDADPTVLRAFAGTGVDFIVGLPDHYLPKFAADPSTALSWVKTNIQPFLPKTHITALTIGNEVLSGNDTALIRSLLPAMQNARAALASLNLDVAVTTAHSLSILSSSYPPSSATFRRDLLPIITPILSFLSNTSSPFLINAYPFFAYKADPKRVELDYVLFEANPGVLDADSGLRYDNMLHAMVDAVRAAVGAACGGAGKVVEIVVSETGWPSGGDEDEAGATPENARRYNGNLMRMVGRGKGTPMQPDAALGVYVFALFNENMKPGPASERHYGLFKPDGSPAYDIGVVGNATSDGEVADSPAAAQQAGASSSTNYYTISSAEVCRFWVVWFLIAPVLHLA